MKKKSILFILTIPIFLSMINYQENFHTNTGKAEREILKLNWLVGYWSAEISGTKMEEFWLPESGNLILGLHRDIFESGETFFEFLRISQTAQGIIYYASPKGRQATEFKLKELSSTNVIFENIDHDFPQRIIYTLKNDSTLISRIEGLVSGKLKFQEWTWYKTQMVY